MGIVVAVAVTFGWPKSPSCHSSTCLGACDRESFPRARKVTMGLVVAVAVTLWLA